MNLFFAYLEQLAPQIDAALDRLLPPSSRPPGRLHEAMHDETLAFGCNGGAVDRRAVS